MEATEIVMLIAAYIAIISIVLLVFRGMKDRNISESGTLADSQQRKGENRLKKAS